MTRALIDRTGHHTAPDGWHVLADGDSETAADQAILPLPRFLALATGGADSSEGAGTLGAGWGVVLAPNDEPAQLRGHVARIALIQLTVPVFKDGRAFSQARQLRQDLGFSGEIRLAGHVLPDQLAFAIRCGVDRILTTSAEPEEHWRAFANRFDVHYQPALDEAPWAARRRAGTVGWVEVA